MKVYHYIRDGLIVFFVYDTDIETLADFFFYIMLKVL